MLIAVQDWQFYGGIVFALVLTGVSILKQVQLNKNVPEAMTRLKAKNKGVPIVRVHYRGRKCKEYIAKVDKAESEIGTPYWTVPTLGLKFKPEPDEIEFIEDTIPCVNYFENIPEGLKINTVVAFSQLKKEFEKIGLSLEGIEPQAFYAASEYEKTQKLERALRNTQIGNEESKKYIEHFLKTIEHNRTYLQTLRLESGVFTWQTAMKAIDEVIGYTSVNAARMKETLRAVILKQEDQKRKDWITYAIVAFILAIAAAAVMVVAR